VPGAQRERECADSKQQGEPAVAQQTLDSCTTGAPISERARVSFVSRSGGPKLGPPYVLLTRCRP
jgi:hypothetical protein